MRRTKYNNKKIYVDGMVFDSRKEYRRWQELKQLEESGEIMDLQRQVKYVLIPSQYTDYPISDTMFKRKCIERECIYVADFQYYDCTLDMVVVEDAKGVRTEAYKIKRKLMLWIHGIRIMEV